MRFADPLRCPDCQGPIAGPRCPQCGLDLTDPQIRELWQTLLHADALLAAATARRDAASRSPQPVPSAPAQPHPAARPGPVPPAPTPYPAAAQPAAGSQQRSWSVGTVLLALGAIGLVTAAIIFVSRSWESIGLIGKALVLGAATAAVIAAAVWVTRRPLRASAEALWAVGLSLLVLDVGGARSEGLFNLDAASGAWVTTVAGAALAGIGAVVVRWGRPHVGVELISAALAATAGVAAAATGAAVIGDARAFWHVFIGLLVAGGLGLALRFGRSRIIALGSRVVVAVFYLLGAGFAVAEALDAPSLHDLTADLHGLPLLVVSLAALGVAQAVVGVRTLMTAVAATGAGLLVVIPAADAGQADGALLAVAGLAVLWTGLAAGTAAHGESPWWRGIGWAAVLPAAVLIGLLVWWVGAIVEICARALDGAGGFAASDRVTSTARELDVWVSVICAVSAILVAWWIARWGTWSRGPARTTPVTAAASVGAVAAAGVTAAAGAPWWLLVGVLVLVAASTTVTARRLDATWLHLVALSAGAAALAASSATPWCMATTWIVLGTGCWALALLPGALLVRRTTAVAAVPVLVVGLGRGVDAADAPWAAVVLVAVAAAGLALLAALRAPAAVRPVLEIGAAATLVAAACCADTVALAAISWAIVGTALAVVAMIAPDRRWAVWPAVGAFAISYVLLIIDSGFSFVEAFTLPPAAGALAGGIVLLRRRPATSSWVALGPGLALALLPSLPQALADPTGLRALLLGLGAVGVLALGLRLGRQAPFLLGAGAALLVVLFNIGPYANAAPRVVVISVVSAALVALGITWEDRVRDGRRMLAFVKEMS